MQLKSYRHCFYKAVTTYTSTLIYLINRFLGCFCSSGKTQANPYALCVLLIVGVFSSSVHAAPLDKRQMAAVMTVVNHLLLNDDVSQLAIDADTFDATNYLIPDNGFTITFDQLASDAEVCFNLSSAAVVLSINGVAQTGGNEASTGENCYTIAHADQASPSQIVFNNSTDEAVYISAISVTELRQEALGLRSLTRSAWDEKAVRKVLRIFAFGGHAQDAQIRTWADMIPSDAIAEMLNFQQHNLKLSPIRADDPYQETASQYGEFTDFVNNYLTNPSSNLPISIEERARYAIGDGGFAFDDTLQYMVTTRGLNPFRQMIGFWETNYHLAVNLDAGVNNYEMAEFYDVIMRAHESGLPYQQVMGIAAKAAAPAAQYGHENNEWINDFCFCNQDFAREIHQLYYGIFGEGDEEHHENVTIPNTASMLTGMPTYIKVPDPRFPDRFPQRYEREYVNYVVPDLGVHHVEPLDILRQTIAGAGPFEKIDALMEHSINHPESLKNLPIMIISVIADDNLDESAKQQLRAAWASMPNKQFLEFIHAYAISELFHGPTQRKYMSSFWRMYYLANKFNTHNIESFQAGQNSGRMGLPINWILDRDEAQTFRPIKNVFGGQTSLDAADSAKIFEDNYNQATKESYQWMSGSGCDDCDQGQPWKKNWGAEIPTVNGQHKVNDVAAWLWKHMTGSLDNYTVLERSHLVSILGATSPLRDEQNQHFDLPLFLCMYNDRAENGRTPNDVPALIDSFWQSCARNGSYNDNEVRWLNKNYTVEELSGDTTISDPDYPNPAISDGVIPSLVNSLGQINMPLLSDDPVLRENANRRIHYAMAFISATPFMLVESGE